MTNQEAYEIICDKADKIDKIVEIVSGTIDHIDYDEAMDMLYDIKDVLKDYERR